MTCTRLNPVQDYFLYSGSTTVSNSVQTLKNVGTLTGTWVVIGMVANTSTATVALQCRLVGSSTGTYLNAQKIERSQQNIISAIFKDESVRLESFCPTQNGADWKISGVRVA